MEPFRRVTQCLITLRCSIGQTCVCSFGILTRPREVLGCWQADWPWCLLVNTPTDWPRCLLVSCPRGDWTGRHTFNHCIQKTSLPILELDKQATGGSWWGVPNPSSQLLEFLESKPNIHESWPIQKSQLILGKQSQSQLFLRANPRSQLWASGPCQT